MAARARAKPAAAGPPLRIGSTGDEVTALQGSLARLGFHPGEADGTFGATTEESVRQFQRAQGLPADGIAGPETHRAIDRAVSKQPTAPPERDAPARLSPSLARLEHVRITAWALVEALLRDHPSYVRGRAGTFELGPEAPDAPSRPFAEWVAQVRPLLALGPGDDLHTRLMILGLALLDPDLYRRLSEGGFLRALVAELREPLDEVLSPVGRERWRVRTAVRSSAPLVLDRPATEDELGREAFAGALAARLRDAREGQGAQGPLLLHIHGAWGSGKSTILNLLQRELTRPSDRFRPAEAKPPAPWVVIDFNAWQHQRIAPPWWWLLTAMYHGGAEALRTQFGPRASLRFRLRDYAWRLWTIRAALVAIVLFAALTALATWAIAAWGPHDLAGIVALVGGVVGVIGAAVGLMRGATRFLLVGSAGGAGQFMTTTRDPMRAVRRRFAHLVALLRPYQVAVFVDDLDRCNAAYIVELLEGIHTLFGEESVTYVVAADRHWVCDSFTKVYADYAQAGLPGRPLGYLFLEKTFQLSSAVPRLSYPERRRFLDVLVGGDGDGAAALEAARRSAKERFVGLETEQQIRETLAQSPASSMLEEQALREAALVQAHAPKVRESREHLLSQFVHLLEPNPRSIKRLVNAYGFELDLQLVGGAELGEGEQAIRELALWTILNLRWPLLGEYVADHPDAVADLHDGDVPERAPAELEPLCGEEDVRRVVRGAGVGAELTPEAVRALVSLHRVDSQVEAAV